MNRISLTLDAGCFARGYDRLLEQDYVRQQTTPLITKTNELDDLTAKNSKEIKDVDQRAQAGIQGVQTKAPKSIRKLWLPASRLTKPRPGQQRTQRLTR